MPEFKVIYQTTPYAHTAPAVMIIEAPDRVEAAILALHTLTQRGMVVGTDLFTLSQAKFDQEESLRIQAFGLGKQMGRTNLLTVEPYLVATKGKVLQG